MAVKKTNPDVLIVDITMPKLSGIEAVLNIKTFRPDIKVIFLTMHTDVAYTAKAIFLNV